MKPKLTIITPQELKSVPSSETTLTPAHSYRPVLQTQTLLGGLIKCGTCAGTVIALDEDHYGCAAHRQQGLGACASTPVLRVLLEHAVVGYLHGQLNTPENRTRIEEEASRFLANQGKQELATPNAKWISDAVKRAIKNLNASLHAKIDMARVALQEMLSESKLVTSDGSVFVEAPGFSLSVQSPANDSVMDPND